MKPSTVLGTVLLAIGAAPLLWKVFHSAPFGTHDWGFFAFAFIGALLLDPKEVGQAIGSLVSAVKGVLPGKGE